VLARANDFVPSAAGAILLDDPRIKLAGAPAGRLTVIACFGAAPHSLGSRVPADREVAGRVYTSGQALLEADVIGAPVVLGESSCGVLELRGRQGAYSQRDLELLRIFAAYISSSIQNTLDALRARELARRDDLTGLYNDRFLHHRIGDELARAERDGTALSLLFMDLDDFKRVNDRHGHLAGSRTLREMGHLIQATLPPGALAARYGGDEFCVILPGADTDTALAVGEALRLAIESTPMLAGAADLGVGPAGLRVTASIGVANYHEHVLPLGPTAQRQNSLLRLADAAMYTAKAAGKNRVHCAETED
jgi:diguanylate cyclase (GGDEF)-like protein